MNDNYSKEFPAGSIPQRNYDQIMGVWINEPAFLEPKKIDRSIRTLAEAGYSIIRIFLRNSNYTHRSPIVVKAVARAVKLAHELGMRAVLDCEPHSSLGKDMGAEHPQDMGSILSKVTARVVDGRALIQVTPPNVAKHGIFDGVEAAFCRVDGKWQKVELDIEFDRQTDWYHNGHIHRELTYTEKVPSSIHRQYNIRCGLPQHSDTELLCYLRFSVRDLVDFWSNGFCDYYEDLLQCYKGIPLDGICWDEPAAEMGFPYYRYGEGFKKAFERLNGYDIADKLYLLNEERMSSEATKVRLDYYRTLNEGVAQAQAKLISKAREVFGPAILTGSHHTWQGEGGVNDLRCGAVDYFRLNDNMDAAYTDCSWWDPEAVSYSYTLASSMARLTPTGEAEVNTWHYKPTAANIRHNVNLMSLLNITWFNIWFGSDADCILQEGHYTWPETAKAMRRHQKLQRVLGKAKPVCEVAIWHGWEGICAMNSEELANAQKIFCLNTTHHLIKRNIASDFIDSRLLSDAKVNNGILETAIGSYRVLVLPYAMVLPRKSWEVCKQFAAAGGRVIVVGTPIESDETGASLRDEFYELLELPGISLDHYLAGLDAICTLPKYRAQRLEVCRPLPQDWPRIQASMEGEANHVSNTAGNVSLLSDLDPKEHLVDLLNDALTILIESYSDNLRWRLYRDADGNEKLVIASADERAAKGFLRWGDELLEVTCETAAVVWKQDNQFVVDGDAELKGTL